MITKKEIGREINYYTKLRQQYQTSIDQLPEGSVIFKMEHGKRRPYLYHHGREKYIPSAQAALVEEIQRRRTLETALHRTDGNLELLQEMSVSFFDPGELIVEKSPGTPVTLPRTRTADDPILLYGPDPVPVEDFARLCKSWRASHDAGYDHMPEGKVHTTSDHTKVRSLSELIIYEFLKSEGVPFLYESPVVINGQLRFADFKIARASDRRLVLWEHFGMMTDEDYAVEAKNKMFAYASNGYWPYDNLIITYDFSDGGVDLADLKTMLDLMIRA